MPKLFVGTSGWNYDEWKGGFYRDVPKKRWLAYCAERFTGMEINATHYRLQSHDTLIKWRDQTPDGFVFVVKANRYLTHSRKLRDPEEPIIKERDQARVLGSKLGAVLWQLPGSLHRNDERLEAFLAALGRRWRARHVLEPRHRSWFASEVAERLDAHGVGVCISDAADWPMWNQVTGDFAYVRLHGHTRTYQSRYARRSLERWAERVKGWLAQGRDVHVYFDNTDGGAAPYDALKLRDLVGR